MKNVYFRVIFDLVFLYGLLMIISLIIGNGGTVNKADITIAVAVYALILAHRNRRF